MLMCSCPESRSLRVSGIPRHEVALLQPKRDLGLLVSLLLKELMDKNVMKFGSLNIRTTQMAHLLRIKYPLRTT